MTPPPRTTFAPIDASETLLKPDPPVHCPFCDGPMIAERQEWFNEETVLSFYCRTPCCYNYIDQE